MFLMFWGPRSKLGSDSWSNSLIATIYPAAIARRHVLKFPPYKMISICQCRVYALQWRIVPAQNRLAAVFHVWYRAASANPFYGWVMAEWLGSWPQQCATEDVSEVQTPGFETGLRLMKQFAHSWNLPCCQCTRPNNCGPLPGPVVESPQLLCLPVHVSSIYNATSMPCL